MSLEFSGFVLFHTPKAINFWGHTWTEANFLPKSQIEIISYPDTDDVTVIIPDWLGRKDKLTETEVCVVVPWVGE